MTAESVVAGTEPLAVHDVTVARSAFVVLEGVTMTLERGIFAALVGPSGSGKTSLLRVLALLDAPVRGFVSLWGRTVTPSLVGEGRGQAAIYPQINYLPQTLGLWPHLTIRDNLLFARREAPDPEDGLDAVCDQLGITTILDRKPAHASQGQRQRAALARALLVRPQILLLDEATAALDRELATTVWRMLATFTDKGGTILASTHDSELSRECDRIYRITRGRLLLESGR